MRRDQTVFEMAEEVLARQAKNLAHQSGHLFERALEIVADTAAGRQLRELANGEHRHEKARDWQASMLWDRAESGVVRYPRVPGHQARYERSSCQREYHRYQNDHNAPQNDTQAGRAGDPKIARGYPEGKDSWLALDPLTLSKSPSNLREPSF